MKLCSVVLVSWNTRDDIARCIDSVLEHTQAVQLELIVIDNGSTDGTRALLRESYPQVRLVENDENRGFARGCNQGMALARGDYILLLNPDSYVVDDVIGRAVDLLAARPGISMLGCRSCFPDGRVQHTCKPRLSIRLSLIDRLWLYRLMPRRRAVDLLLSAHFDHDEERECDWLAGVFLLLRRQVFEESGGFDERFWMYGEDSEWGMRLRRSGHRILFAPQVGTLYHAGSVSSHLTWSERERLRLGHRGGIDAYSYVHGRLAGQCYRAAELLGCGVRWLVYSVADRLRPDDYRAHQATYYRWLVGFYLRPG